MQPEPNIAVLAHLIQLLIAPAFLFTGVGSLPAATAARLARVIDRVRFIESAWRSFTLGLARHAALTGKPIDLCACTALLVCALIATLFVDAFVDMSLKWPVETRLCSPCAHFRALLFASC